MGSAEAERETDADRERLLETIRRLEDECEALRQQVAMLALAAGGGARL